MKKIRFWAILAILVVILPAILASQDTGGRSEKLSKAFQERNTDALLDIMNSSETEEEKARVESLVLEEARSLVFTGELDNASKYAETVLLADFMNQEAQDLFISIDEERQAKAKLEEKRLAEEAEKERLRLAKEAEKRTIQEQADKERKEEEFVAAVQNIGKNNFSVRAYLSPLSLLVYSSEPANDYLDENEVRMGYRIPGGADLVFNHPYVYAALRVSAGFTVAPFDDADPLRDLSARVSVGTPLIKVPLRFAAGVYNLAFDSDDGGTVLFREITSPAVGFTLEDIRVNDMIDISAGFLWLTASAQDDGMDAAFTGDIAVRIKLIERGQFRFFVSPAVSGTLIISGLGNEWNLCPAIFAGVIYNEYK